MKIKEERKLMEKLNRGRTLSEKAYDALCNVICKMAPWKQPFALGRRSGK